MPFNKKKADDPVVIVATHPWHPGDQYLFYMAKRPSVAFTDAQSHWLGLSDDDRKAESRSAFVAMIAALQVRDPEGFEDYPQTKDHPALIFAKYFDDPEQPELEPLLVTVWRTYKESAAPSAYLKSFQDSRESNGELSRVSPASTSEL